MVGTTWQYQYFALLAEKQPVAASPPSQGFLPEEGATGWSDTWMICSEAAHPNCMYMWMDFIVSPKVERRGRAVVRRGAGAEQVVRADVIAAADQGRSAIRRTRSSATNYHADDPAFWKKIYYWITPVADCGDDRGTVCKDNNDWVQALDRDQGVIACIP